MRNPAAAPKTDAAAKPQPPAALLPVPVVLKPAPANILELYLGSLEALGFDLKQNDVRFVEDDWETPPWAPGVWAGKSGSTAWR